MIAYHCDRDDCDTWSNDPSIFTVVYHTNYMIKMYCTLWCMVVEESKTAEPTEVIDEL